MLRKFIATVTLALFALGPVAGWAVDSPAPVTDRAGLDAGRMARDLQKNLQTQSREVPLAAAREAVEVLLAAQVPADKVQTLISRDPAALFNLKNEAAAMHFTDQQINQYVDGLLNHPTTIVNPSTTDNTVTKDAFGNLVDAQGNTHPDTVGGKLGWLLPAGSDQVASWDLTLVVNSQVCRTTAAEGAPYINNQGRTMIPLRVVNDAFGYQTDWQPDGTIHITDAAGTVDVSLTVGQAAYTANGQAGRFATLPTLTNNRTYLPARDFAQLYGHIYWDNPSRTVWVYQGKETLYQVIGTKVLRGSDAGIQELTLPAGYTPLTQTATNPLVLKETIQGVTYLGLMTQGQDFSQKVPLFQVKDQSLIYLTDVFGSSHFYVDGSKVYYTDGTGAAGWTNPIQPNRLYIADTASGQVTSHDLAFPVNTSTFSMKDGKLIATDQQGTAREIELKA